MSTKSVSGVSMPMLLSLGVPYKTTPYAHQLEALVRSKGKLAFAWFMDMGTGKSKVLIDDSARLYLEGEIEALLIVANKGSYLNWEDSQINTHLVDQVPRRIFTWMPHKAVKLKEELQKEFKGLTILVMNIESFVTDKAVLVAESLLMCKSTLMVVDESTTIKNPKAKRTQAAISLGKLASYRRIMTGDPINRDPLDLWGQCEFLRAGILGCASYFAFRATYANLITINLGPRSFKKVEGFKNTEKLTRIIQTFSYRVKKEDCLDLPPKTYQFRYVELTDEQNRYYNTLRDESIAFFGDSKYVTGDMVMKRLMKLHQIVCGSVKMDDGTIVYIPNNRINNLLDDLDDIDGKVIIWATYRPDIFALEKAIKHKYGVETCLSFFGDTDNEDRATVSRELEDKNSPVKYVVSNPSTGGYGNTWNQAKTMLYYSNSNRLEHRRQSEERNYRIGQDSSVTVIDYMCKGTVEEKIIRGLLNSVELSSAVMGDKWKEWLVLQS